MDSYDSGTLAMTPAAKGNLKFLLLLLAFVLLLLVDELPSPWREVVVLGIVGTALSLMAAAISRWREKRRKGDELKRQEAERQTEEKRGSEQAGQEEDGKRGRAKANRQTAKQRKEALLREWLDVMKQWQAQAQKGLPRNPTVIALIERQRERAEKESDPDVKAWLMDRVQWLQRPSKPPNWIRPEPERAAAWAEAKRRKDQERLWQGTGGPPKTGPNWIRSTWPDEARDFTPWLAKHLELVSACTGLDLRFEGAEVYAGGGRADIVARDHKSKSQVVIENQLDAADLDHRKQLSLYGEALNAKIRIWIAANFNANIRRDVRNQNRQNESRSDGAIYYLLRLMPDRNSPISLVEGPRKSQAR